MAANGLSVVGKQTSYQVWVFWFQVTFLTLLSRPVWSALITSTRRCTLYIQQVFFSGGEN